MISEALPYAQVGGTIVAAVALLINAWQFWRSRKTTTLQHLQEFLKVMNEREAALSKTKDNPSEQLHAFIEFLNFLEIYSSALNADLFIGVAREIVCDKILDSVVALACMPHWHDEIENSITSAVTYKHISLFMKRHKRALAARQHAAIHAGTYA